MIQYCLHAMVSDRRSDDTFRLSYQVGLPCQNIALINDDQNYWESKVRDENLSITNE